MPDVLPALPPCYTNKHGRHDLSYLVNEDVDGHTTQVCDACGMVRRFANEGRLTYLDDAEVMTEVAALFPYGETR
jgi:hypothetical protein